MNRLPAWHKDFLRMLPTIRQVAHVSFRHLHGDAYDEAVEEVIANACVAYPPAGRSSGNPSACLASWHWSSPACMATQTFGRVG